MTLALKTAEPILAGSTGRRGDTASDDLRGQVDQFGVLAPRAHGDRDVPAGAQHGRTPGEDAGGPRQQAVVADIGEVAAVERVAVAVVVLVHLAVAAGSPAVTACPCVDGPRGG
ncbi:hypothetical protein F9C11_17525 [Amycolatopsis sp. VS8301801F10]|uniref:hypothetical protein n=1 Tax=unclassified Amycolatopsis TaxID=2618356 RepID=UPI0038FBE629